MPGPWKLEEVAAVRREIVQLLRQQIEALDSPLGLSLERLSECYQRQERVQELRERLQALVEVESRPLASPASREASGTTEVAACAGPPPLASADAVASI